QLIIAVRRDSGVWIVDSRRNVLRSLREADGPVLLLDNGRVLYQSGDQVILSSADGVEISYSIPDARALFRMSEHWAGVRTNSASYAIRAEPDREQMFELPEPAP